MQGRLIKSAVFDQSEGGLIKARARLIKGQSEGASDESTPALSIPKASASALLLPKAITSAPSLPKSMDHVCASALTIVAS